MTKSTTKNLANWSDPAFWQKFAPELHVCDSEFISNQTAVSFNADTLTDINTDLLAEGYTRFQPKEWLSDMSLLAVHAERLHTQNFLPVFSFVFDEYWLLFAKLREALSHVLGAAYQIMPETDAYIFCPPISTKITTHRKKIPGLLTITMFERNPVRQEQ